MRAKLTKIKERASLSSKKWWAGFNQKQKFSVTDSDTGAEKWYMFISPFHIVVGLVSFVVVLSVTVVLLIIYTPLMDTIPGYPGRRSREMLIHNIMRLDSLEREMANLTVYSDNIELIMEGKTPVIRDITRIGDSIQVQEKVLVPSSAADSILRARMQGSGDYSLAGSVAAARSSLRTLDLVPPAQGLVQTRFDPRAGRFGVQVATTSNHPVVAVREGNIMLSVWTPDEGNIVEIQHSDNLVSTYKHLSDVRARVGTRVKAGEIIGQAGSSAVDGGAASGPLEFELWYNGTPVDPENYIVF